MTGCATCKWVKPGITVSKWVSAKSNKLSCSLRKPNNNWSVVARSQSLTSVATWSFRLRPVCKRFPASPILSVRRFSIFKCTSSKSNNHSNWPASTSCRISANPTSIARTSSALIIFCAPNICACAKEP